MRNTRSVIDTTDNAKDFLKYSQLISNSVVEELGKKKLVSILGLVAIMNVLLKEFTDGKFENKIPMF